MKADRDPLTHTADALCDAARVQAWAEREGSRDLIDRSFTMRAATGAAHLRAYEHAHGLNTWAAYRVDVTVETFEIPERAWALATLRRWELQSRRTHLANVEAAFARMTPGIPGVAYDEHRRYVEHHREIARCDHETQTARRAGSSCRQMAARRPRARRRGAGRPRGGRSCARSGSSTGDPDLPEPPPPLGGRSQGPSASTSPEAGWLA